MKLKTNLLIIAAITLGAASSGCAAIPKPVITKSKLGSVIIYRNGVAFFERYAGANEKEVSLRVPSAKVNDFLSSLNIIDTESGEALPVSYPTVTRQDGYVQMSITLPKKHGRLKISYVTESPAWKPSYRVILGEDGKAQLQGWAVVDNASGEAWKNVRVGVGSTSALTFRYDLSSVRLVEREMLTTGEPLAYAPPTGGSPYAVATKKVRVLGSVGSTTVALAERSDSTGATIGLESASINRPALSRHSSSERSRHGAAKKKPQGKRAGRGGRVSKDYWGDMGRQAGNHRIRVEGYAQSSDGNKQSASLKRANVVRDQLIKNGVAADRIDVVATGVINNREAVRVLATEDDRKRKRKDGKSQMAAADTQPVGHAHFLSDEPMSIDKDHSAMVSMLNEPTDAKRVYYYDPISNRGSKKYAFNAVRITNPSQYTLDPGPFTVYAKGQFLGEGLSDAILPKKSAFIPYALDRSIVVTPELDTREEIERLVTIQRGVVTTETRRIRRSRVTIANRSKTSSQVFVRHKVAPGFTLTKESKAKVEKLNGAHLFAVDVPGGEAVELIIEEWSPLMKTVDIRTDRGVRDVGLFIRKRNVPAKLKGQLTKVFKSHQKANDYKEKISLLADQMVVFRTRVNELNFQLMTLRKVPQAAKLRGHLAKKMEEISNELQNATLETSVLKTKLMTLRIELQDSLAELSLVEVKPTEQTADKKVKPSEVAAREGS